MSKKKKIKRIKMVNFYELTKNNLYCIDGESHNMVYISYTFKTKLPKQKRMNRLIKWCNKCGAMLIDPENFEILRNSCDKCVDKGICYRFKPAVVKRETKQNKKKIKPFEIYEMEDEIKTHECTGTPEFVARKIKGKEKECVCHFCKTCNKYYCLKDEASQYKPFRKIITLVDYDKYIKEKEVERYIRNNFDKFISKEKVSFSTTSRTVLEEEDYFRILSKIKRQNQYDFLIKGSTQFCRDRNHRVYEIEANVDIVERHGEIYTESCPAYYCEDCNVFYIFNATYEQLKEKGIVLCKIYDMYKFSNNNDYFDLNSESMLHTFGYNVNANEDLSTFQRQIILKSIVDNRIMSKNEIINHLSYLYNRSKNLKSFNQACRRWKEDIDYISEYKINNTISTNISSLKKINYIRK